MTRPMRRDAARNRDRLLREGARVFTEQGLAGSLEEIARRAGVSIGTLYNHFPSRDALIDALVPSRLAEVDELAARSDAEPDPWLAFAGFAEGLLELFAADRGLLEAFTEDHPAAARAADACHRAMAHWTAALHRARRAGAIREDAGDDDILNLLWAVSLLGGSSGAPAWRGPLRLALDGLRPAAA